MKGLWKYDLMVLGAIGAYLAIGNLDFESAQVSQAIEEEARVGAAAAAGAAVAALDADPATTIWLLNPVCPDQYVAQRGAGERWRKKCITVSTEGSRVRH